MTPGTDWEEKLLFADKAQDSAILCEALCHWLLVTGRQSYSNAPPAEVWVPLDQ